jgi:hypothetical protein
VSQINTREVILLNSTVTTSSTGPDINLIQGWQAAIVSAKASAVSGTSPTFDLYVQKQLGQCATGDLVGGMPTGTDIYDDVLHFTQITTNTTRIAQLCTAAMAPTANAALITTADWAVQDAAIAAATIRVGPIGGLWRLKYVVAGTSPSALLSVTVQLIPFGT